MKVLIDTNILIDYFGERETFYEDTIKLKAAAFFGDVDIWATSNSFTDVFYILHKEHESLTIQDMFLHSGDYFNICSITSDDIYETANEHWPDFEDCLVHKCAQKIKSDYLLTRDKEGFAKASIPCLTPAEFFVTLKKEMNISYEEIIA